MTAMEPTMVGFFQLTKEAALDEASWPVWLKESQARVKPNGVGRLLIDWTNPHEDADSIIQLVRKPFDIVTGPWGSWVVCVEGKLSLMEDAVLSKQLGGLLKELV